MLSCSTHGPISPIPRSPPRGDPYRHRPLAPLARSGSPSGRARPRSDARPGPPRASRWTAQSQGRGPGERSPFDKHGSRLTAPAGREWSLSGRNSSRPASARRGRPPDRLILAPAGRRLPDRRTSGSCGNRNRLGRLPRIEDGRLAGQRSATRRRAPAAERRPLRTAVAATSAAILHGTDPIAICAKLWREGVVGTTLRRWKAKARSPNAPDKTPGLVACEEEYPAVTYVFPGDGPSVCHRLGLVALPSE